MQRSLALPATANFALGERPGAQELRVGEEPLTYATEGMSVHPIDCNYPKRPQGRTLNPARRIRCGWLQGSFWFVSSTFTWIFLKHPPLHHLTRLGVLVNEEWRRSGLIGAVLPRLRIRHRRRASSCPRTEANLLCWECRADRCLETRVPTGLHAPYRRS